MVHLCVATSFLTCVRCAAVGHSAAGNKNNLELRSNSPQWVYSYAPLVKPDGTPVDWPQAGAAGYAMALNDKQVGRGCRVSVCVLRVQVCKPA